MKKSIKLRSLLRSLNGKNFLPMRNIKCQYPRYFAINLLKLRKASTTNAIETGIDTLGKYALTIGGNESDGVRSKVVRLDKSGFVRQQEINPFISVIQNLK